MSRRTAVGLLLLLMCETTTGDSNVALAEAGGTGGNTGVLNLL